LEISPIVLACLLGQSIGQVLPRCKEYITWKKDKDKEKLKVDAG
jgi:hypothetical protein